MAYNREKIKEELISNIEADEDITTFSDAAATVEPTRKVLYEWEFHKSDNIKRAIANNKVAVKRNLRKQWKKEDASPTLQLALYKLLSTEDELRALSMQSVDHSGKISLFDALTVTNESDN